MSSKALQAEIEQLEARLAQNADLLGLHSRRELEHSPAIQDKLAWILGGAFAGGLLLGLLNRRIGLLSLLPYALRD